ncbi:MAG: hypothetical protein WD512_20875 [Candidatus Paceibacterota bacterium]
MKSIKYITKFHLLILLVMNSSCESKFSNDNSHSEIIEINDKVLYEGKRDTLNNFFNYMTYFSKEKNPLIEMLIYENNDSTFHYKFIAKNNIKKIIYLIEVKNGEIIEEYNIGELKTLNIDIGSFYYKNYCYHCHHIKKESIGKSITKLKLLNSFEFNKKYHEKTHEIELTKDEIDSIYGYIIR